MDNLAFGLQTTVIGMGIVFGVLAILWCLLTLIMKLDERSGRAAALVASHDAATERPEDLGAGTRVVRLAGAPEGLDPRLVAAVTVAILRHEETRRLQAAPAMRSYWPGSLLFASRWVAAGRTRQGQSWRRRR
ncbi:MAG TPA: OadG family protein [Candidatus Limnocylindrales bacterium]|nr:OadG family protein [Candidatus Limnocylindrales bacterium]